MRHADNSIELKRVNIPYINGIWEEFFIIRVNVQFLTAIYSVDRLNSIWVIASGDYGFSFTGFNFSMPV